MDTRSLWQRKALKGSRLRLLIWGALAAFLVVENLGNRVKQCGWYVIIVIPVQLPGIICMDL